MFGEAKPQASGEFAQPVLNQQRPNLGSARNSWNEPLRGAEAS